MNQFFRFPFSFCFESKKSFVVRFESSLVRAHVAPEELGESSITLVQILVAAGSTVPHQRLVVAEQLNSVLDVPASAAEILEAVEVTAKVWALTEPTRTAKSILEVRVHLDLKRSKINSKLSTPY